jgi:hypothetical protein
MLTTVKVCRKVFKQLRSIMKILSEKPSDDIIMEFEMSEEEKANLIKYGKEHVDDETLINFAIVDMLKKGIDYIENADEEAIEVFKEDIKNLED